MACTTIHNTYNTIITKYRRPGPHHIHLLRPSTAPHTYSIPSKHTTAQNHLLLRSLLSATPPFASTFVTAGGAGGKSRSAYIRSSLISELYNTAIFASLEPARGAPVESVELKKRFAR